MPQGKPNRHVGGRGCLLETGKVFRAGHSTHWERCVYYITHCVVFSTITNKFCSTPFGEVAALNAVQSNQPAAISILFSDEYRSNKDWKAITILPEFFPPLKENFRAGTSIGRACSSSELDSGVPSLDCLSCFLSFKH